MPKLTTAAAELDAAAVVEAALAVPEEVGVPVAEATALLEEVSACEVTFLLPQTTDWQTDWHVASSGWAAVHSPTAYWHSREGRV